MEYSWKTNGVQLECKRTTFFFKCNVFYVIKV